MKLTHEQNNAVKAVRTWFANPYKKPWYYIGGAAGTGKSTIAQYATSDIGDVLAAAFTGKAASVLRKCGFPDASTIHSLIYAPSGESTDKLEELIDQLSGAKNNFERSAIEERIREERRRLSSPSFSLRDESILRHAKLLILDEVSMVNERVARDLLSFGVPLLILGDPNQLEPVFGSGYFTCNRPDTLLTEIHRQALESPIIRMSQAILQGTPIPHGSWDRGEHGKAAKVAKADVDLLGYSQVLVGMNRTRRSLNMLMRKELGYEGLPKKGEKLICLRNNHDLQLLNGTFATLGSDTEEDPYVAVLKAEITTEFGTTHFDLDILRAWFDEYTNPGVAEHMTYQERKIGQEYDFGYAISVHKAQGSGWDSVVFYDDGFMKSDRTSRRRLLYTACTRAAENFCWAV